MRALRLDRFICSQRAERTRSTAKELCKARRIRVNGEIALKSDRQVDENADEVELDGERIVYRKHLYIMLNKPQGVVCSTKDGLSPTVLSLLPQEYARPGMFPAGRLDKDTEGFVLLTDDGELAHRMLSPVSHVAKTYFVRLERPCGEDYPQAFSSGMTIDGGEKCLPAEFFFSDEPCECTLILREGKYHQVKRMFAALGNKVVYLKRTAIGKLPLDTTLPLGGCLEILHKDVEKLTAL